jgi:hypothetical protein
VGRGAFGAGDQSTDWVGAGHGFEAVDGGRAAALFTGGGESILDPFKSWICEQLQADPKVPSQRLRELSAEIGYAGGKTIFDAYARKVRPRFLVKRTFQRTIYRPAELVQCDLWEPSPGTSRLAMGRPVVGGSSQLI